MPRKELSSPNSLVCIVDDSASMRSALMGLMRSLGLRATEHATAESFLASGDAESAVCVVTDIQMPGLSGFDLKSALDARRSLVPVIMITARMEENLEARAVACGAYHFLRKPFDSEALIVQIRRALGDPAKPGLSEVIV